MRENYWTNREKNKEKAAQVVEYCKNYFSEETDRSVARTYWYPEMHIVPAIILHYEKTTITVIQGTTCDAIWQAYKQNQEQRICALNFASYKNPGGKFIEGSMAQEESLCHSSNLYNILSSERIMDLFYLRHKGNTNKALYLSEMLYIPDVQFVYGPNCFVKSDVITCAAPNRKAAQKYFGVTNAEVNQAMFHRIDSILYNAGLHLSSGNPHTLILGAFGCGVFGNDRKTVVWIFHELLQKKYKGVFDKVVFAIPDNTEDFASLQNI